ncbi:MAG: response regulator transcription factor [Acidobacteria bacterium]|nr:response regulator transcription factor [Acidobacteriota bacterium]
MSNEIRVFIADDHPVFLRGLRMIIESERSLKIVGEAAAGDLALERIVALKPDVAVLDVNMPEMNGFELARALRTGLPETKVIFLTMHDEEATLNTALDLGVRGYILKDSAIAEIVNAIKQVARGRDFITPKLSGFLVARCRAARDAGGAEFERLTAAERKILRLIADHKTTREIAAELFVSPRTVDRHRYNICHKLGLRGINSLVIFAIENKSKIS